MSFKAVAWTLLAAAVSQVPMARFDVIPDPGAQIGFLLESPSRIVSVAVRTSVTLHGGVIVEVPTPIMDAISALLALRARGSGRLLISTFLAESISAGER